MMEDRREVKPARLPPGFLASPFVRTVATVEKETLWCAATWIVICRWIARASFNAGTVVMTGRHLSISCIRETEKTTRSAATII